METVFESGLRPSAAVGAALFPAASGCGGARLRCSFGLGRPTGERLLVQVQTLRLKDPACTIAHSRISIRF